MTQEQLDLLRSVAEQDKDNCISIAILKLLDMVEEQKAKLDATYAALERTCFHCESTLFYEYDDDTHWQCPDCETMNSDADTVAAIREALDE